MKRLTTWFGALCFAATTWAGDGLTWNDINFGYQWAEDGGVRLNYADHGASQPAVTAVAFSTWQKNALGSDRIITELDNTFFTSSVYQSTGARLSDVVTAVVLPGDIVSGSYGDTLALPLGTCRKLVSIGLGAKVKSGTGLYRTVDGVLYSRDLRTLVAYPAGRNAANVIVPDGVEVIGPHAFDHASGIRKLVLPASVKRIGDEAFANMAALEELHLSRGLSEFGYNILKGSTGHLKAIYCTETTADELYMTSTISDPSICRNLPRHLDASFSEGTFTGDRTYVGWACDANGVLKGTLTFVAGKPNRKTKLSKVTATYLPVSTGRKVKTTAQVDTASAIQRMTVEGLGTVAFSAYGVRGVDCDVEAGVDYAKLKGAPEIKAQAMAALDTFKGVWTFRTVDGDGETAGVFALTVKTKGKATLAGTTAEGVKISCPVTACYGSDGLAVPVVYSKKGVTIGAVIWIDANGRAFECTALTGGQTVQARGRLPEKIILPAGPLFSPEFDDLPVMECDGRKLTIAKNALGFKLTLDRKTGLLKGSFRKDGTKYTVHGVSIVQFPDDPGQGVVFFCMFFDGKGRCITINTPLG